jgi:hypothetical protein
MLLLVGSTSFCAATALRWKEVRPPGAQVDRLSPLQSAARSRSQWRHIRLASRLIPVFSGVDSWFHLQCVFGVLLESGEGGKW